MSEDRFPLLRRYLSREFREITAPPRSRSGFRRREPGRAPQVASEAVAHELRTLLAGQHTDDEWGEILRDALASRYDPRREGMAIRDWLHALLLYFEDRIRTEARQARPGESHDTRAARLRPFVAAEVERIGCHELAVRTNLPPDVIAHLVSGGTPSPSGMDAFIDYEFGPRPDLAFLSGSYLGEGSSADLRSEWTSVIRKYASTEATGRVRGTVRDIDRLLRSGADEQQLQRTLEEMGCAVFPPSSGLTYRNWLEQVRAGLAT